MSAKGAGRLESPPRRLPIRTPFFRGPGRRFMAPARIGLAARWPGLFIRRSVSACFADRAAPKARPQGAPLTKNRGFAPCVRTRFLRARDSRSSEPFNGFAVLHFVPARRVIGSALRLFHPLRKRLRKQGSGKSLNPPLRGGFRLVSCVQCPVSVSFHRTQDTLTLGASRLHAGA